MENLPSAQEPSLVSSLLARPAATFVPRRVMRLAQIFVGIEASSGIVLLVAAIVALIWANSPWKGDYFSLLHTELALDLGFIDVSESLQHGINDGLMTIFFFLMGLEIKREMVHGELSSVRRALLPATAALGGMIAPAVIYSIANWNGAAAHGWGIPMATDIAFALGVLSLLGPRIPFSVKIFLLGLAIADDIGAILVIAIFYTANLDLVALGIAALILGGIFIMNRSGVRNITVYVAAGTCLWLAVFESGIHATLAGVALGLLTPASYFYDPRNFADTAQSLVERYRRARELNNPEEQQGILAQLEDLSQGTESPLERLERTLLPWSSFFIVPLFALANAGVTISGDVANRAVESPVSHGVALGLFLGKPLGIMLFTFLAVKLRLCEMPTGANWKQILGVGMLGGVGFTVSLLVTDLAFRTELFGEEAKLGVLCASAVAGVVGFLYLRFTNSRPAAQPEPARAHAV